MDNDFVSYSRAGDAFHYRWAARRCLKLLDPNATLKFIVVEGSKMVKAAGEYVIDLAEYSESDNRNSVAYYQLKHTSRRRNKKFTLSELKHTLAGFAKRYSANIRIKRKPGAVKAATFHFVTNRPVGERVKKYIKELAKGERLSRKAQKTFASLSPEEPPRYYRHFAKGFNASEKKTAENSPTTIELILSLDNTARVIINELLALEIEQVDENSKSMLENAAVLSPGVDINILNQLIEDSRNAKKKIDPEDVRRQIVEKRIEKLRAFRELAMLYEKKLKQQIGER